MNADDFPSAHRRASGGQPLDFELAVDLAELRLEVERRRLTIFRAYGARRVRLASPLLLSACGVGELDQACWRLRPPRTWPRSPMPRTMVRGRPFKAYAQSMMEEYLGKGGPHPRAPAGEMLILRLSPRTAHMVLRAGGAWLSTDDRGGRVVLPGLIGTAGLRHLVGGPVERALEHSATVGGDYVVLSAQHEPERNRTVLEFAAPPTEWRLPWARPPGF